MEHLKKYPLTQGKLGLYMEFTSMEVVDELENIRYTTYGLCVTSAQEGVLFAAPDVNTDMQYVQSFIELCTRGDVHPVHIPDLLEDYLA